MQIWLTILALASCLIGSIASPLNNLTTNLTAHAKTYDQCLQLIFHRRDHRGEKPSLGYWHYVFHGKPSHPIDACESKPVAKIYYGKLGDINEPEWLNSAVKMSVPGWRGYKDCYYVNDGLGNPGSLECGTDEDKWLRSDFTPDPAVNDPILHCWGGNPPNQ